MATAPLPSPPPDPALHRALAHLRSEPSRTWSLIITVFGDAIVPRGGSVWLGTLLMLFKAMGISEGVVRTAVSRLASDGWLERERVGRHSFYRLGPRGQAPFAAAGERIYRSGPPAWPGGFDLVLLAEGPPARDGMRAAGLGSPSPGLWIAPKGIPRPDLPAGAIRLEGAGSPEALRALAARAWPLEETATAYRRFVQAFTPLRDALDIAEPLTELEAFVGRILLIHEYRRIVLRDPALPAEILPVAWPGEEARRLCAAIYPKLAQLSEPWLDENAVDETGAPLPPNRELARRFVPPNT